MGGSQGQDPRTAVRRQNTPNWLVAPAAVSMLPLRPASQEKDQSCCFCRLTVAGRLTLYDCLGSFVAPIGPGPCRRPGAWKSRPLARGLL